MLKFLSFYYKVLLTHMKSAYKSSGPPTLLETRKGFEQTTHRKRNAHFKEVYFLHARDGGRERTERERSKHSRQGPTPWLPPTPYPARIVGTCARCAQAGWGSEPMDLHIDPALPELPLCHQASPWVIFKHVKGDQPRLIKEHKWKTHRKTTYPSLDWQNSRSWVTMLARLGGGRPFIHYRRECKQLQTPWRQCGKITYTPSKL